MFPIPDLLVVQVESFKRFLQDKVAPEKRLNEGLQFVFNECFPIEDVHGKYSLDLKGYRVGVPRYSTEETKRKKLTYSAPLWVNMHLVTKNPETKKVEAAIEQEVYLCELPMMTERGTFIINGIERVVVNQLHRSPGVYYEIDTRGAPIYKALLVPYRGPWIEFTIDGSKIFGVTISKRRKIPITRLLRALGYPTATDIFKELFKPTKRSVRGIKADEIVAAEDVVDESSGEVILEAGAKIEADTLEALKERKIKSVLGLKLRDLGVQVIYNTLRQDRIKDEKGAIGNIYRTLRYTPPRDEEEGRSYIESFFFSPARFYLDRVGRYKLNFRLGVNLPKDEGALTRQDLLAIIGKLIESLTEEKVDDVDDLANRRVRRVGELLQEQFRITFLRLARVIKERMLLERDSNLTPKKLVNPRLVTSSILSFYTSERLSQFLDQTNPLAELSHKRRLSALGRGGLTRETAGFEIRDVHPSHYGRLCPIETPEGQNIGLITSLTTYAKINPLGFITTPLRRVKNGKVFDEMAELASHEEHGYRIASADTEIDPKTRKIIPDEVWVRYGGGYPLVKREQVDFIDVSPRQVLSPSAALIPFLEHDDANRALMGCNMQKQSVPLIAPEIPLVGTGLERRIARDSGVLVQAERNGTVVEVDADHVVIEPSKSSAKGIFENPLDMYDLVKFQRSNQNTIINQRPVVSVGQKMKAGDVLADGSATREGELALGRNLLVAFVPWLGYNFEDAVVVSERVLEEDVFTSIHVLEFEVEVRETKLGPEEVTGDLPNVSEEAIRNLDDNGIVRIGTEVKPDDILVGKVSPKGERELTPEEQLIYAIFVEKAKDVRDTSKRVPPGITGVVVDVTVLSRKREDALSLKISKEKRRKVQERAQRAKETVRVKLQDAVRPILSAQTGTKKTIKDKEGKIVLRARKKFGKDFLDEHDVLDLEFPKGFLESAAKEKRFRTYVDEAGEVLERIKTKLEEDMEQIDRGDELPPGVIQLVKVYVAQKRKLQVGDKVAGRHGNKGVVAKIAPMNDMPFLDDGIPVDVVLNPLGVPSRMNVGQILETILGWAAHEKGIYYAAPVFEGMKIDQIKGILRDADLPEEGKAVLRDGRTGIPFDYPVTVGHMYMMKLIHMVEDKVHARATGPYSLITQQPVGGKSHFGGQRFGEMEVWALEAYGAAHILQEMLTVKSDDIKGRNQLYQAVIKGEDPPEPGLPASFDVLLKKLRGLALDVEIEVEKGGD
jgi:DNA-directed RNA polymerase subunit beta